MNWQVAEAPGGGPEAIKRPGGDLCSRKLYTFHSQFKNIRSHFTRISSSPVFSTLEWLYRSGSIGRILPAQLGDGTDQTWDLLIAKDMVCC